MYCIYKLYKEETSHANKTANDINHKVLLFFQGKKLELLLLSAEKFKVTHERLFIFIYFFFMCIRHS